MALEEEEYKALEMSVFKAKLCEYVRALAEGRENAFVIRRYRQDVAVLTRLDWIKVEREADRALSGLRDYMAAQARFAEQRRMVAARALRWPLKKFALLRRPPPAEEIYEF